MRPPVAIVVASLFGAGVVSAEPYRLRADAYGMTSAPQSPVGLVVLQGVDRTRPWVDAEALIWAGAGERLGAMGAANPAADALVMLVRLHDPKNTMELRLGRQILAMGAIRPIHLDGAHGRLRIPIGTMFEAFGGVPTARGLGWGAYDWAAGGRVSQRLGENTVFGATYLHRRSRGDLAFEELGVDLATSPGRWFDLGFRAAYDLISPAVTEATASLGARIGKLRPELYGTHRSPAHLLPATSLFSALGDQPSDVAGLAVPWAAAPRLDVLPSILVRRAGGEVGGGGTVRAILRFDDAGNGSGVLEFRRESSGPDPWTGVRIAARVPLYRTVLFTATELELAVPDNPRGRGTAWPWALVALGCRPAARWEVSGAVEASATPTVRSQWNGMLRLTRTWGGSL